MANHGYVKTRCVIKVDAIETLLKDLNASHFQGNLSWNYEKSTLNTWMVKYVSSVNGEEYASRIFWLNTSRSFEMRHGGGTNFAWWIDSKIINEVACRFKGTITDDGGEKSWQGEVDKYPTFRSYLDMMMSFMRDEFKEMVLEMDRELYPPEFLNLS